MGVCASLLFQVPAFAAEETQDTQTEESTSMDNAVSTDLISGWPTGPELTSTAAVVMEESTKTILYAKNMDQALYPGTTVKIMTCLLALENSQLTDQVIMTDTGVSGVTDGGVSIAAQLNEVFSMEQALYAVMAASANDLALQVAEHVGGTVDAFVEKMNARAAELGCTNTVFTNPTGLPDENQHTTAHDMALIMKAAMANDAFRTIAAATGYTIPATNVSGGERVLTNKFTMVNNTSDAYYEGCLGGKEGFTEASGSTLVCAAKRNDMTLICVVLQGASGQTDDEAAMVLDYGFNNFRKVSAEADDFSLISGGSVVIPADASIESLTFQDTEKKEKIRRKYFFNETPVGSAVLENVKEEETTVNIDGAANMKEAEEFTAAKSVVPYFVITAVGLLLIGFLISRIVKISKS